MRRTILPLLLAAALSPALRAADPWSNAVSSLIEERIRQVLHDPGATLLFIQETLDDFSPGFYRARLDPAWRKGLDTPLDRVSRTPWSDRVDLSINLFLAMPSANLKLHLLKEGAYWPELTLGLSGWISPLGLVNTGVPGAKWPDFHGLSPYLILSHSIKPNAKAFLGYKFAWAELSAEQPLPLPIAGLPPLVLGRIVEQVHAFTFGAAVLADSGAETAAWLTWDPVRREVHFKSEVSWRYFTVGLGLYPDRLFGFIPIPHARLRVRF